MGKSKERSDTLQWLVEPQFDDVGDFSVGMAKVKKSKWGYIKNP